MIRLLPRMKNSHDQSAWRPGTSSSFVCPKFMLRTVNAGAVLLKWTR
ncbi:hypothetical protein M3J09_006459 [Ascochyta lentis]